MQEVIKALQDNQKALQDALKKARADALIANQRIAKLEAEDQSLGKAIQTLMNHAND